VQGFGRRVVLEETQYEGILGKPRGLIRKRLQSAAICTTLKHAVAQMNFPLRSDE